MENNYKLEKKGFVELLLFFLLPLFVQFFLRKNFSIVFVDYLTFFPLLLLLFSIYKINLKKRFYYIFFLIFLLLPDYGSVIFFIISFFSALIGLLFVFFPILIAPLIYFSKRADRLASVEDYFNFGLKFSGISLVLLFISFFPNYIGQKSLENFPSSKLVEQKIINIENYPISIREYKISQKTDLESIFDYYKIWLNRPFYRNFKVNYKKNGFIIDFENVYDSPLSKFFSIFCYLKDKNYHIKIAEYSHKIKKNIFHIKKMKDRNILFFKDKKNGFGGRYSNKDLTLLPKEMAIDSGFTSDFVFLINKLDGSAIQYIVKSPDQNIKLEHYYYFYEDILKKEYNNFKTVKKDVGTLLGKKVFYLEGTTDIGKVKYKMFITMISLKNNILIILGTTPVKYEDFFKKLYMSQLNKLKLF